MELMLLASGAAQSSPIDKAEIGTNKEGEKIRALGEMNYPYLLIKSIELHLIKPGGGFPVFFEIGIGKSF